MAAKERGNANCNVTYSPQSNQRLSAVKQLHFANCHTQTIKVEIKNYSKSKDNNERSTRNISYYFSEFCQSTSIHGFKFLGERNRYFIEKIWWLLVVSVAAVSSSQLIYWAHEKWLTSPVIVTFAKTETSIWDIPFPAVTICPEVKSDATVFNYTNVLLKYLNGFETTKEEDEYYNYFSLVCDKNSANIYKKETETMEGLENFLESLMDLDFESCWWLEDEHDCNQLLTYSYTSEGLCRTFNMMETSEMYFITNDTYVPNATNNKQWSLEDGYSSSADLNATPRRTMLSGLKAGLQLNLFVNSDNLDYFCRDLQGFKVTLHNPAEEPDMDKHFRLPLNQAVIVGIKPRMISTSKELRSYTPAARQCYFSNEKVLGNFKVYTQQSCVFECLSNYTVAVCGCIGFYMPYVKGRKICDSNQRKCMEEAKVHFLEKEVTSKLSTVEGHINEQCGCLPACSSLKFDSETSQSDWDWRKTFNSKFSNRTNHSTDKNHYSRLMVYYKDMQFMTSQRQELYGTIDFWASCGGLLGLFCGFSFTSVMEILYFLTLRLVCNFKNLGRMV